MPRRNVSAQMASAGFQTITLSNSTASGLNSTCQAGRIFHFSIETNSIRYRADGTAPALSTGVLLSTGDEWLFDVDGSKLKFQRQTGTAKVSVQAYKYLGE
jgi:hypothetical protein